MYCILILFTGKCIDNATIFAMRVLLFVSSSLEMKKKQ